LKLPLLPNRIEFGRIQRRVASYYGVWLIPKRHFVEVISGGDAASDGPHLAQRGGRQMALLVAKALSPVLKPSSGKLATGTVVPLCKARAGRKIGMVQRDASGSLHSRVVDCGADTVCGVYVASCVLERSDGGAARDFV
jgi:hypothetical protein